MKHEKTFFGQPLGLLTLFGTEFWERFSYYGMRAILFLYLTSLYMSGGFSEGTSKETATAIYGVFTGLVYVTPIIGGMIADKILGQRLCIYIGALVIALGQFTLAGSCLSTDFEIRKILMFSGIGLLIAGNGFFKPNISTMVGEIYPPGDPRKDTGFTIFYMGINMGSFLSPFIAGFLGEKVAWEYGFLAAGVGMIIGTVWYYFLRGSLHQVGLPPAYPKGKTDFYRRDWTRILIWVAGSVVLVSGTILLIRITPERIFNLLIGALAIAGIIYLAITILKNTEGVEQWKRVGAIFILAVFNLTFWIGFEQAGTSLTDFANVNTDRSFFGWEIPASFFQSINPVMIILLAPVFSWLWMFLNRKKINPSTPVKFVIALVLLGIAFLFMSAGFNLSTSGREIVKVSALWLVTVYFFQTVGELFLSPIGLSMITKLSPPKIVSVMMGLWMGSVAAGNYLAQQASQLARGYNESLLPWINQTLGTSFSQMNMFSFISLTSFISAALLLLFVPYLNKTMKNT